MADTFALEIAKFVEKAQLAPALVVRKLSIDMFRKVVMRTPVGNPDNWASPAPVGYVGGRLRANWNLSINVPDTSTTPKTDGSGAATIAQGLSKLTNYKDGDVYMLNSLPYVRHIEYTGHSKQAPQGMVRVTVTEFQTLINNAVRSLP